MLSKEYRVVALIVSQDVNSDVGQMGGGVILLAPGVRPGWES